MYLRIFSPTREQILRLMLLWIDRLTTRPSLHPIPPPPPSPHTPTPREKCVRAYFEPHEATTVELVAEPVKTPVLLVPWQFAVLSPESWLLRPDWHCQCLCVECAHAFAMSVDFSVSRRRSAYFNGNIDYQHCGVFLNFSISKAAHVLTHGPTRENCVQRFDTFDWLLVVEEYPIIVRRFVPGPTRTVEMCVLAFLDIFCRLVCLWQHVVSKLGGLHIVVRCFWIVTGSVVLGSFWLMCGHQVFKLKSEPESPCFGRFSKSDYGLLLVHKCKNGKTSWQRTKRIEI